MNYADRFPESNPFIMEAQVVATNDPDQMGRVRAWVPAIDGENFDIDQLPWADYATPFAGFTVDMPAGEGQSVNNSHAGYGFWAIPKVGSTVLVFFLNGNPTNRCYFGSMFRLHRNRSLPAGRNVDFNGLAGPWGDAGDGTGNLNPIQPAYDNLRTQFQGKITQSEAVTRGAFERAVAQASNNKDGQEGYSPSPADPSYLDPQTYCLVTPGRNAIIMQDDPNFARLRLKTAEGHQIIFDDANERIYMSTARGNTWIELDQDGHINIFGSDSVSIRSGKDLNFFADGSINFEAAQGVNIKADAGDVRVTAGQNIQVQATGSIVQSACGIFDLNGEGTVRITAANNLDMKAGQSAAVTGGTTVDLKGGSALNAQAPAINLQGSARPADAAGCAEQATGPTVVPGHEPWTRPTSSTTRGTYWKA